MIKRQFLLILFCTILFIPLNGQKHFLRHYDTDDGLPSIEIYDLKHGYDSLMWFATESGIYSFDGYDFYTYTDQDDNQNNFILRLYSLENNIWYSSIENQIGYVSSDEAIVFIEFNDKISEMDSLFRTGEVYVDNLLYDKDSILWVSATNRKLYKITNDKLISEVPVPERFINEKSSIRFFKHEGKFLWQWLDKPKANEDILKVKNSNSDILLDFGVRNSLNRRTRLLQINNTEFIFAYNNRIFHFKDNQLICNQTFDNEIIDVYFDVENNQTWVSLFNGGALLFNWV